MHLGQDLASNVPPIVSDDHVMHTQNDHAQLIHYRPQIRASLQPATKGMPTMLLEKPMSTWAKLLKQPMTCPKYSSNPTSFFSSL